MANTPTVLISLDNLSQYTDYIEEKSPKMTLAEYNALTAAEKSDGKSRYITDKGYIYKNNVIYGESTASRLDDYYTSAQVDNLLNGKVSTSDVGTAAAKDVDVFISDASASTNVPTSQAVAAFVEGKGYLTTDNDTTYILGADSVNNRITLTPSSGDEQSITVPYAANAGTVNNHTVESDVPNNAVFTDTTYTGISPINVSGTSVSHVNSGVTASSKGDTSNQAPSFGGTFKALSGTVNATGHLTAFAEHNVTIPSTVATTSTAGLESAADKTKLNNTNVFYGTCASDATAQAKVATLINGTNFTLAVGAIIGIKFTNTNTYSNVTTAPITLNVQSTGAKNIWYNNTHSGAGNTGTNTGAYGYANRYNWYMYDGTYWVWMAQSIDNNSTYATASTAEILTGTATTKRSVTAATLNPAIQALSTAYGTCTGQAANQEKAVVISNSNWVMRVGAMIAVKFDANNTYTATTSAPVKLNVNSKGAKQIYGANSATPTGTNTTFFGRANYVNYYIYDGTYWVWAGSSADNNTTYTPQALGFGYGTCSTIAATTAKVVSLSGYALVVNGIVSVKFTNAVPASATLNINSKGAKPIYFQGASIVAGVIEAGDVATFVYNGSQYVLTSIDTKDELIKITYSEYKNLSSDVISKHNYLIIDYPA